MISQYNKPFSEQYAVRGLASVVSKRIKFQGFVVTDPDFGPKWRDERDRNMLKVSASWRVSSLT